MTLPSPNLDDRRFQDLVDDAKRLVQQRCPDWTDHNVSDPGVTMIELFASMVDQLLYRLNRVPDRNYVKFLDLIGVRLLPPTAAEADVTFWLSAPQPAEVAVPAGTEVATTRTEAEEAITFSVVQPLRIIPARLTHLAVTSGSAEVLDRMETLRSGQGFACFDDVPRPGNALLIGLPEAVPRCAVVLRFECEVRGVGVDPENPPLCWEGWNGRSWSRCEMARDDAGERRDGTGGLNQPGDVVLHVPGSHTASLIGGSRAGWLRCRVLETEQGQRPYASSPVVRELSAYTVGGTTRVVHAEMVEDEMVGVSEGTPGQRFPLKQQPVVPTGGPATLEVAGEDGGWEGWRPVDSFGDSGPDSKDFLLDHVSGEVSFGPAVREADGSLRQYGAVPAKGAVIRIPSYRTGGGRRGNVARETITVLKSSIPYITRVQNRLPATRGVDAEDMDAAKVRGPILLRTGNRAVTAEDYECLAQQAAPDVARVRCVPSNDSPSAGAVRVLVVPWINDDGRGGLRFEDLRPPDEMLATIAGYLGDRKVIGARVMVEPPVYQGITVVGRIRARARSDGQRLRTDAVEALHRHFHPLLGGAEGTGWDFGRPVHVGEVYSVLQRVRGTEYVEDVRLFAVDPITGQHGEAVQRIQIERNSLVFSYRHQVQVEGGS
jgi:predicted phage baseplate assembly protein